MTSSFTFRTIRFAMFTSRTQVNDCNDITLARGSQVLCVNPELSLQSLAEIAAGDRSEFPSVGVSRFMVVGIRKRTIRPFTACAMMGISTRRFNPSYNSGFPLQLRLIRPLADTRNDGGCGVLRQPGTAPRCLAFVFRFLTKYSAN